MFFPDNLEFFFNLSEKIDLLIGHNKFNHDPEFTSRELIEIELEKLERVDNENIENSLEAIFTLCFGISLNLMLCLKCC